MKLKHIQKICITATIIIIFLLISSCNMCDGKADAIYNFDDDEYEAISDFYFEGVHNMEYVEMLAEYADSDKVFDHDGNTGIEAFMDDVELGQETFYEFYDAAYIFGFYTEDYPDEEAGGFYTNSLFCHEAIGINLDYFDLGLTQASTFFHEGAHAAYPISGGHSNDINDILDELGSADLTSTELLQQIIDDGDIAYLITAYYLIVEQIMITEPDWCSNVAQFIAWDYEPETDSSEEILEDLTTAKESLATMDTESWASLLAGCMYGDEYTFTDTQVGIPSCYDLSTLLDYLGITEEELTKFIETSGHVDDWSEICENEFEELETEIGCFERLYLGESLSECSYSHPVTYVFTQDDVLAPTADDYLFIDSSTSQYIADGSSGTDISFTYQRDDYDIIYILIRSSVTASISFYSEGEYLQFPLAADAASTAGEASDEPIYWGDEAPTSTNPHQDELIYLEGETCTGITSVADCQGAMFMFIDADQEVHLVEMTSIDTGSNQIHFEDLGAEVSLGYARYTDGIATSISLTSLGTIGLVIDETAKTITFTDIGSSDGAVFRTFYEASFEIINNDLDSQIFEGLIFSEHNDGAVSSYITDLSITITYDDVTDDIIKIDTTPLLSLSSADGYGWYYESSTDHDTQLFKTWKGTSFYLQRHPSTPEEVDLHITHPHTSTYGIVHVEPDE